MFEKRSLSKNALEQGGLQPAHIHKVVVVIVTGVAAVAIENPSIISQQICPARPNSRERFAPKLNADLPLRCNRASRQSSFDRIERRVWSCLFQTKWRFPLTHFDLCPGNLMPVNKNVGSLKGRSVVIKSVAVFKIAFDLEIELLGKIACQIDACPAQAEPIFQRRLAKASLECGNIAVFKIHLDEST